MKRGGRGTAALPPAPRGKAWIAAVPVAVALLASANTVPGDFIFDDTVIVQGDARLQAFDLHRIFRENWFGSSRTDTQYRPLTLLSFALNFRISDRPWAFHAVNVVLNGAVAGAFYLLARQLLASRWAAAGAAAVFAALPIHTEAVANIVGRAELLAALAVFLAWWIALRSGSRDGPRSAVAVGTVVLLGMLSKENTAVVAALIPLSALLLRRRVPFWASAGAAAGALLYCAFYPPRFTLPALVDNPLGRAGGAARVLNATALLGLYAFRTVLPLHLSADHSYDQLPVLPPASPALWLQIAALAAPLGLLFLLARKRPALALGPAVFLIAFAPTANVFLPIGTIFGERLAFLPSAGYPLLLAAGLEAACKPPLGGPRGKGDARRGRTRAAVALLAALVLAYSARSWVRNADWSEVSDFNIRLAADSPRSTRAHDKAAEGWVLRSKRERSDAARAEALKRAEAEIAEALRIYPENAAAHAFRVEILAEAGRHAEAMKAIDAAEQAYAAEGIEKDPALLFLRAQTLFYLGRPVDALESLDRYLARRGPAAKTYHLRGLCRIALKDSSGARSDFDEAIRLNPRNAPSRMNRGIVLAGMGQLAEARRDLDAAVDLDPENPQVYTNRGYLRFQQKDVDGAIGDYRSGLRAAQAKGFIVSGSDSVLGFRQRIVEALLGARRRDEARAEIAAIRAMPSPLAQEVARELEARADG